MLYYFYLMWFSSIDCDCPISQEAIIVGELFGVADW